MIPREIRAADWNGEVELASGLLPEAPCHVRIRREWKKPAELSAAWMKPTAAFRELAGKFGAEVSR